MKITDAFIGEHAVLYCQLDHLETAVPAAKTLGEIKALAALLEAALRSHAALEDELLFNGLDPGSIKSASWRRSTTSTTPSVKAWSKCAMCARARKRNAGC
jgi:hypothetical protein